MGKKDIQTNSADCSTHVTAVGVGSDDLFVVNYHVLLICLKAQYDLDCVENRC